MPTRRTLPTRRNTPSRTLNSAASIVARADAFGALQDLVHDEGQSYMSALATVCAEYRLSPEEAMDVAQGISEAYPVPATDCTCDLIRRACNGYHTVGCPQAA